MAKILENQVSIKPQSGLASLEALYHPDTIAGFIGGRLIEKQNEFNDFLQKIEETCRDKSDKEAINILPQTIKTIKTFADKLSKELGGRDERELFLRFAEARSSQTLTMLKKIASDKTENYKQRQVLIYCAFLIKSSKDLYNNPQALAENIDYYAGYISLLPEYYGTDLEKKAVEAVYIAAIGSALDNKDTGTAKAYLTDKRIYSAMTEEKYAEFTMRMAAIEEENIQNAVLSRFNPQTFGELEENIKNISEAARKEIIPKETGEKIIRELKLIFNVNLKNRMEAQRQAEEQIVAELIGKIITANIKAEDILSSGLSEKIKNMMEKILETENAENSPRLRDMKKKSLEKLADAATKGEITSPSDIASEKGIILDAAGLLQILRTMKNYRSEQYALKETA